MAAPITKPEPRLGDYHLSMADVCDGVVDLIHSVSLSMPFIAERSWLPRHRLEQMGEVVVSVAPGTSYAWDRISRAAWRRTPTVSVLVQKRLDAAEDLDEQCDRLMGLVEELRFALCNNLTVVESCDGGAQVMRAQAIEADPLMVPDHLEQLRQFTSGLLVTFMVTD